MDNKFERQHPDYNGYNNMPNDISYITYDEFINKFFHYCFNEADSKHVFQRDEQHPNGAFNADLRLFNIGKKDYLGIGIGRFHKHEMGNPPITEIKYFTYGKDFYKFECNFAAQFSGDNS